MLNWKVLPISCGARFPRILRTPKRPQDMLQQRVLESWPLPIHRGICPSFFVSLRSVLILLPRIVSRIPNQRETGLRYSLCLRRYVIVLGQAALLSLLTCSIMVDENLVRISILW